MSLDMAMSIFRRFSICSSSLVAYWIRVSLLTPSTRSATVGEVSLAEMKELAARGDFLAGSMGPKVRACMKFVENGGGRAIITSLDHAFEAITEGFGTQIVG